MIVMQTCRPVNMYAKNYLDRIKCCDVNRSTSTNEGAASDRAAPSTGHFHTCTLGLVFTSIPGTFPHLTSCRCRLYTPQPSYTSNDTEIILLSTCFTLFIDKFTFTLQILFVLS